MGSAELAQGERRAGAWAGALVVLVSAVAWGVVFWAVPYRSQDFPLADDWAYARGAIRFAHGEGLHYLNWSPMPQLAQWLWGAPALWLSGDSLAALRLSMIVLSWVGLWGFYDLLRQEGVGAWPAALGATTLALHPLFFLIQGSFMTDVPSLALCLAALAFYGRAFRSGRASWLWPAMGLAILAAINRQNTVAAPMAAGLVLLGRRELRWRPAWLAAAGVPCLVAVGVHKWFTGRPDVMLIPAGMPDRAQAEALPFVIVLRCGLAALPALLLRPWPARWRVGGHGMTWGLGVGTFLVALMVMLGLARYWLVQSSANPTLLPRGGLFPYIDGHINWFGAYSEVTVIGGQYRPVILTSNVRQLLTLLGCVAGALLVTRTVEAALAGRLWRLLPLFTLLGIPLIYATPYVFDRRLLFVYPGAIWLALATPMTEGASRAARGIGWGLSLAALGVFAVLAVGITHDSLAWNAARWALGRQAVTRGMDPWDIEGGFEWDGWYAPEGTPAPPVPGRKYWLPLTRQQFTHVRGRYGLSFVASAETPVIESETYTQWLPPLLSERPASGQYPFYLIELPRLPEQTKEGRQ